MRLSDRVCLRSESIEVEIKVQGMVCGGCSSRVTEALQVPLCMGTARRCVGPRQSGR